MNARAYLAELIGTFVIVFAPVATSAHAASLEIAATVSGLSVLAMIYVCGPISGAHFNPAVSIAFARIGNVTWDRASRFIACQLAGAILAAGACAVMFGPGFGVHIPADGNATHRNIGTELVLSFVLMFVIAAVATDRRVHNAVPGFAIGLTVLMNVLIGGPVTGGSMNPARSLGPALFGGQAAFSALWLYLLIPPIGATLGAIVYQRVRAE